MTRGDRTHEGHPRLGPELSSLAETLARRAGAMALAGRRGASVTASTKSSPTDMVTEYDTASERLIVEGLVAARPDDAIVGEEGAARGGTTGITWHIDPIDGTSNFFFDLPLWAVSIGAVDDEGPLAGAVYLPVLDEMYVATRGGGATMNGRTIRVSAADTLATSLVGTGFGYDSARRTAHARLVAEIIGRIRDIRRFGAAAADLCLVACGRLDAFFEEGLSSWDLVAGQLIATEAGAIATDYRGARVSPAQVLVSAPGIHASLVDLLGSATVTPR